MGSISAPNNNELAGRLKTSIHQNIFEADFEYGLQPLRWQVYTAGAGYVASAPGTGGVYMSVTTAAGDIAIRQSRPYHRYQPGKTMYMATNVNFGGAVAHQRQRVGFFDDGNGIFFQQGDPNAGNPSGMFCVVRSDINGIPTDTAIDFANWSDEDSVKNSINWNLVQMLYIEYAWYGAGGLRWGVLIDGVPHVLHHIPTGNSLSKPWCRTGNLPVRYELRNLAAVSAGAQFYHYGVSVLVDGQQDQQRGFTFPYGLALGTPTRTVSAGQTRYPLLSMQYRPMGTQEFTQGSAAITGTPTTTGMTVASLPAISSITVSGTTATVTFASAHGMVAATAPIQNGMAITGTTPAALSGFWPVTVTSTTTVTFTVPSGTASATVVGTATPWAPVASLPAISSIAVSGTTATMTFASAHGIAVLTNLPTFLTIAGATPAGLNGTWQVTVASTTTVTFQVPNGLSSATVVGTATQQGQWVGRYVFFPGTGAQGLGSIGRITANTATTLSFCDNISSSVQDGVTNGISTAPAAAANYIIGLINRGLVLPRSLTIYSTALCQVELIMSTPSSPIVLTGASFAPINGLGSIDSFTTRDVSATAMSGGEVVHAFPAPAGGSGLQTVDLTNLFPLYNVIQGNLPDILTLAVTTASGTPATVGATFMGQEQMS